MNTDLNKRVQSVLIRRDKMSQKDAVKWLLDHGFQYKKIDVTKDYYRFRQFNPVSGEQYRNSKLGDLGYLIIKI